MWTSADEYCEQKMLEERENNIEEVRKQRDNLREYCEELEKRIEEIRNITRFINYKELTGNTGMPYDVFQYERAINDVINHITMPLVYPNRPKFYKSFLNEKEGNN